MHEIEKGRWIKYYDRIASQLTTTDVGHGTKTAKPLHKDSSNTHKSFAPFIKP